MVTPNTLGQQIALQMGWTGEGQGAGGVGRFLNTLSPQKRAEFDAALGGRARNTAPVANMPALIEPLHQYEMSALKGLAGGADTSQMEAALAELRSRMSGLDTASGYTSRGVSSITPEEVYKMQNPYADTLKTRLSADAEKIRAAVNASQGLRGGRSFGDTSTGIQNAEVEGKLLQGYGEIDYKTWQDALGQINNERNRLLTGAGLEQSGVGTAITGAGASYDMAKGINQERFAGLDRQLGAGRYIRDYNQGVNDVIQNDMLAGQQDPYAKLQQALALLSNYGSNTSSGQKGGMASPLTQFGIGATGASGLLELFKGGY